MGAPTNLLPEASASAGLSEGPARLLAVCSKAICLAWCPLRVGSLLLLVPSVFIWLPEFYRPGVETQPARDSESVETMHGLTLRRALPQPHSFPLRMLGVPNVFWLLSVKLSAAVVEMVWTCSGICERHFAPGRSWSLGGNQG